MSGTAPTGGVWFSRNPSKAWGEKFFLIYSPIWMLTFGVYQRLRLGDALGDLGNLVMTGAIFLPVWLVPVLIRDECALGRRWYQTYWFKFNLWILIYSAIASYFFTEYFFDVMGMIYHYPHLHWSLDAKLLGSGRQVVPIIMYLHAHYFFLTYHSGSVVVMRRIRTSGINVHPLVAILTVVATAGFFAWGELYFTTAPGIADQFRYEDMAWALKWGVWFYACYFIVSFPMVSRLDEQPGDNWSVRQTVTEALAAGMLTFLLLDLLTGFVGAPYHG